MTMQIQFFGAAEQVTGSLYVIRTGKHTVLLECGLVQGSRSDERQNTKHFPLNIADIDAVILSHAHIDHSGRIPLLAKLGFDGPIITHHATRSLCEVMLPDSGYLHEKDAEWENKEREKKGKPPIEPLYTKKDGEDCIRLFSGIDYEQWTEVVPGLSVRLHDAGHILGSAIVEIACTDGDEKRTLVFSGDLGYRDAPVMNAPARVAHADAVLMESTYGDRLHRSFDETIDELSELFEEARAHKGNILIPAFTIGRTQDLLFLMAKYADRWHLRDWQIFLDSPMGIDANHAYARYAHLYDARLFGPEGKLPGLPNFRETRTTEESMEINSIRSGAIIIAGSGMCSGGRIHHHLKYNVSRPECHLVIVGYQAYGTLGRRLVDGIDEIRLWGEKHPVRINLHTVGGLSAHADQADLLAWYGGFDNKPPVHLVHGEPGAQAALRSKLESTFGATVSIATYGQTVTI